MGIQHLNENEVKLCADAIATSSAAESVSDKSKKHLRECEECQKIVNSKASLLKLEYSNDIANCLNNSKLSSSKYVWVGIIVAIIIAGIIGFGVLTNNSLLVLP